MVYNYKAELEIFFNQIINWLNEKKNIKEQDVKKYILESFDLLEIPHPASEIEQYFFKPKILIEILTELLNSDSLIFNDRSDLYPLLESIVNRIPRTESKYVYKFCVLAPGGLYPNQEIKRGNTRYLIQNQRPIILTKDRKYKDEQVNHSLINWLTKNELKFAIALMCAPKDHHGFCLDFSGNNSIFVDCEVLEDIPDELKSVFLKEYFDLKNRFIPIGSHSWHRHPISEGLVYEFSKYNEDSIASFNKLYDSFKISDVLLLRTCNYFVKSRMLWNNQVFYEDAIANSLFCLEGCLHLLQKKYGDNNNKLNLKLLNDIFIKDIPYGENLFEFIKEGYENRIIFVHPEPKWGAEWSPYLLTEDYYDYLKICRSLLNFILINRTIDF